METVNSPELTSKIKIKWQRLADLIIKKMGVVASFIMKVERPYMRTIVSSKVENGPYMSGHQFELNGSFSEKVVESKKYLQRVISVFLAASLLMFFSGCEKKKEQVKTKHYEKVRLGLAMQPQSSLIMIALQNGYFEKNGLDVEVLEFPSGKRALKDGFFKGKVDITSSSDVPVAVSMLKGLEFKIAAVTFSADNVNRVIARKDAGINKPADLAGKRIATQKSSAVHFFLHLFIGEHGISQNDVEMIYMKAEKLPSALANGDIDAFSMREPYITEAKELLGKNYVVFSEPGLYSQVDMLIVDNNIVLNSPKTVNSFIRALIEAEEFTVSNPEKAMSIISKKLGVSYDSIHKIWPDVKLRISLGQSAVMLMEDIARWAIKEKLTEEYDVPNSLDYIYFNGVEAVKPHSITVIR